MLCDVEATAVAYDEQEEEEEKEEERKERDQVRAIIAADGAKARQLTEGFFMWLVQAR